LLSPLDSFFLLEAMSAKTLNHESDAPLIALLTGMDWVVSPQLAVRHQAASITDLQVGDHLPVSQTAPEPLTGVQVPQLLLLVAVAPGVGGVLLVTTAR
jgi:hypothetical protein